VAACSSVDVDRWWRSIRDLWLDWFAGCFGRVEPRRSAWSYVQGLMSLVGRKNCWWLAQQAGHGGPGRLQRLLDTARWDADVLRDALLRLVAALVAVADGVLVVDETGYPKGGDMSVAVARHYSGTLGKVDNCQVAVFLGYATCRLRLLVDRALYLPKTWAGDPDRRAKTGVPEQVGFATKTQLALTMIRRAVTAGIAAAWVAADTARRVPLAAGAPFAVRPERSGLLPVRWPGRYDHRHPRAGRRRPLGDRGMLQARQRRDRPGPLPGPPL